MEDQIPQAISRDYLQSLLGDALKEADPKELTLDDLDFKGCEQAAYAVLKEANNPLVHKIMLHMIVSNMMEWHSKVSVNLMNENEPIQVIQWARDAGKWQAIMNILETIQVDDRDETCMC
tara:strand:- start:361 stop:720 length:360 start_codon:yes stop_codon:yes gene_type:complete